MANYDRRILVPYLQDVCTVEMICARLERDTTQNNAKIGQLQQKMSVRVYKPSEPGYYEKIDWVEGIPSIIIGVLAVLIGLFFLITMGAELLGIIGIIGGAVFIWAGITAPIYEGQDRARKSYYEDKERYERLMKNYNDNIAAQPGMKKALEEAKNTSAILSNELSRARAIRNELYGVNIIPRQYRNIYAVYYLYDFISSGRETDLEKVIQTFVLEEIKRRLDVVISQNQQILINQRVQIAMQEQQNRAIAENHRSQMRQIARMEHNQELQNDYLRMIEKNQQVTNYILAADYVRKYYR